MWLNHLYLEPPLYSISNILGKEVQGLNICYIMDTCFEAVDHVYFL